MLASRREQHSQSIVKNLVFAFVMTTLSECHISSHMHDVDCGLAIEFDGGADMVVGRQ